VIKLAVTGHRGLPARSMRLIDEALRAVVYAHADRDLTGLSCVADGADALFAQAVLDAGGRLIVIVPAEQYRQGLPESHLPTYDSLISKASEVLRLDHVESDSAAHMDASLRMIALADELIAVWDGQPARGYGGTADVVAAARERGLSVTIVWPDGAQRG
jgi:hypothetical protein